MGRWKLPFSAASPDAPEDETWEVGIHDSTYRHIVENSHSTRLARIILVKEVLESPTALIQGWSRPGKEDCWVYIGRPARDYRSPRIDVPAPPGKLFLVFVLPDGTVDHWTWRDESEQDPEVPEGFAQGKVTWRRQKKN